MAGTVNRDEFGLPKVYPSCRPDGTAAYYTGIDDNGNALVFNLTALNSSKTVDMTFTSDVYLRGGKLICIGAPFGAHMDAEIVHPQAGVVAQYANNVWCMGNNEIDLTSDDRVLIPAGLIIRVTVNNSTGLLGYDAPATFKVIGVLSLFVPSTL